eukprot:TRINITY_DN1425_c0_g2_i1.p1 TRINITY_DN1425_c0_g2~~TRINITY_DN1425_c0_g2_i1.p1  ORF type:complete len:373 (-),score=71.29 TRINITY_DN1425_c0_g2_i1:484-1602(-)
MASHAPAPSTPTPPNAAEALASKSPEIVTHGSHASAEDLAHKPKAGHHHHHHDHHHHHEKHHHDHEHGHHHEHKHDHEHAKPADVADAGDEHEHRHKRHASQHSHGEKNGHVAAEHSHAHTHVEKETVIGGRIYHAHDGLAPHTHEPLESPGLFDARPAPLTSRDFKERAFTIGIGGPVGTGKTALMLALCREYRDKYSVAAVTNDIFTQEDGEFLVRNGALPPERIRAVETGGCPHAAIREDISINLGPLEELSARFNADILLCESGGDNLAANFSRELADYIIYIIDVAGGDKIPRKGGPGITQADLLVINKTDLAEAVGADLKVMERDSLLMRDNGPFVFAQVKHGLGVSEIAAHVLGGWHKATGHALK